MIGVFDSGVGGLSIFAGLLNELPQYDYLYMGDTQRAPYGVHTPQTVYRWTRSCIQTLFDRGCELIILACHTASNTALRRIQQEYLVAHQLSHRRVLGVTIPLVEEAVRLSRGRVGVLCTRASRRSGSFLAEFGKRSPQTGVFVQDAPVLVSMIEEGLGQTPEARRLLKRYLRPLKQQKVDTLLLGCTHFPILYNDFVHKCGKQIGVIPSASVVAASLRNYLERHPQLESRLSRKQRRDCLLTEESESFLKMASCFNHLPALNCEIYRP